MRPGAPGASPASRPWRAPAAWTITTPAGAGAGHEGLRVHLCLDASDDVFAESLDGWAGDLDPRDVPAAGPGEPVGTAALMVARGDREPVLLTAPERGQVPDVVRLYPTWALAVTARGRGILARLCGDGVALLPLACSEMDLWLVVPRRQVPLDWDASVFRDGIEDSRVVEPAFRPADLEGETIFWAGRRPHQELFITGSALDTLEAEGFRGLDPPPAWSEQDGPVSLDPLHGWELDPGDDLADVDSWIPVETEPDPLDLARVREVAAETRTLLDLEDAPPDTVVRRIDREIPRYRDIGSGEDERIDTALSLGFLFAEQLERAFSWEWRGLHHGGDEPALAVVSPDRSLVVEPVRFILDNLCSADPVVLALWRMIGQGGEEIVPEAPPWSYRVIG